MRSPRAASSQALFATLIVVASPVLILAASLARSSKGVESKVVTALLGTDPEKRVTTVDGKEHVYYRLNLR